MIRLYATYNGLDIPPINGIGVKMGNTQMIWSNVKNEIGENMVGKFHSNRAKSLNTLKLKKGDRYVIGCKKLNNNKILYPTSIMKTNKNPRCSIIRNALGDSLFIKGKFKGKWLNKMNRLEKVELKRYLLYLGKNTNNEATIKNVLNLLKKLTYEEI